MAASKGELAVDQQLASEGKTEKTTDQERAAEKRKAAVEAGRELDPRTQHEIDGLLIERRGYVDRLRQVDEQISARGGTPPVD